jgi:hypothetical protein
MALRCKVFCFLWNCILCTAIYYEREPSTILNLMNPLFLQLQPRYYSDLTSSCNGSSKGLVLVFIMINVTCFAPGCFWFPFHLYRLFVQSFYWLQRVVWKNSSVTGLSLDHWLRLDCLLPSMPFRIVCCKYHTRIWIPWPFQSLTRLSFCGQHFSHFLFWGMSLFEVEDHLKK